MLVGHTVGGSWGRLCGPARGLGPQQLVGERGLVPRRPLPPPPPLPYAITRRVGLAHGRYNKNVRGGRGGLVRRRRGSRFHGRRPAVCEQQSCPALAALCERASAIRLRGPRRGIDLILSYKGSLKGFTHSVTQGPRPGLMRVPLPRAPPRHFAHAAAPRRAVVLLGYLVSCRPKPAQRPRRAGSRDESSGARNARSSKPAASRGDEQSGDYRIRRIARLKQNI